MSGIRVVFNAEGKRRYRELACRDLRKTIGWLEAYSNLFRNSPESDSIQLITERLKQELKGINA